MLGALMLLSQYLMQMIPNVHLLSLFIAATTLVYGVRALIPLYIYIFLLGGVWWGFTTSWMVYLYAWLPLWGLFMLVRLLKVPQKLQAGNQMKINMLIVGLHGFTFEIWFIPVYLFVMGLSFEATVAWLVAGLSFSAIHAVGNIAASTLIIPLSLLLRQYEKKSGSW